MQKETKKVVILTAALLLVLGFSFKPGIGSKSGFSPSDIPRCSELNLDLADTTRPVFPDFKDIEI